jgi:hypothetical protein
MNTSVALKGEPRHPLHDAVDRSATTAEVIDRGLAGRQCSLARTALPHRSVQGKVCNKTNQRGRDYDRANYVKCRKSALADLALIFKKIPAGIQSGCGRNDLRSAQMAQKYPGPEFLSNSGQLVQVVKEAKPRAWESL